MTIPQRLLDWIISGSGRRWVPMLFWIGYFFGHIMVVSTFLSLELSLLRAMTNVIPLALLFYINLYLVNQYLERGRLGIYLLLAVLAFVLIMWLRLTLQLKYLPIDASALQIPSLFAVALIAFLSGAVILVLGAFYQLLINRAIRELQREAILKEQQTAKLQFLRAQINPHFLFNTLNNIYSLAVTKSDRTGEMVLRLSDLLRYVIYDGQQSLVDLVKEIDQLKKFIELFQMKQEFDRDVQFIVQGVPTGYQIEPMILIPLVENCFKHCDFEENDQAFIEMNLVLSGDQLSFTTRNSYNPDDQQRDKTGGVGLENIRHRLQMKYPDEHHVTIKKDDQIFEINVQMPLLLPQA